MNEVEEQISELEDQGIGFMWAEHHLYVETKEQATKQNKTMSLWYKSRLGVVGWGAEKGRGIKW